MGQTDIRRILIDEIRKDVVGPRGGRDEILPARENPVNGYLSGILFPTQTPVDREDEERNDTSVDGEGDDAPSEQISTNVGLKPSSFGLTCTISENVDRILARVEYGIYSAKEQDRRKEFHRIPLSEDFAIHLDRAGSEPFKANSDFSLKYSAKRYGSKSILSVFVVNKSICGNQRMPKAESCMFQPKITLTSVNRTDKIFMGSGSSDPGGEEDSQDTILFDMLFMGKKNFAKGHGCAVEWDDCGADNGAASKLETTFIPSYTVPNIRPREIVADGLSMEHLCKNQDISEYRKLLHPVADEYERWVSGELEPKVDSMPDRFKDAAKTQIKECRFALGRIRNGIEIVSSDATAGEAFRFANRAMLLQQSYGRWARKNRDDGKTNGTEPAEYSGSWRLFQLAFLLLNIESIHNPRSKDRSIADLLWFATGGGKTEAYMGIIAFTMAHRRLRNSSVDHLRYGTSVIMRYTLRLLTLQQFHRMATLMCGCEFIRRRDISKWGDEPFLAGLWVGSNTTPNTLQGDYGADEAIKKARDGKIPGEHSPIQIVSCPWCGRKIDAYNYKILGKIKQCRIYCPNKACEFSQKPGDDDSGLPVLVVDEDIYKRCPSLIIGTVDKFAQISWKWETGSIFGKVNKYCEKHGFVLNELDDSCNTHRDADSFLFEDVGASSMLEPPELVIQDELHLIAGPLGTMTGIYETAIDALCATDDGILPKIIASTATTRRSREQIQSLFDRKESRVFPPQGITFGDSFFAEEVPLEEDPGKTYIGVCAAAKNGLSVLGRISAVVLRKTRLLKENSQEDSFSDMDLDAYYTLVSYFNSIRELGGASKMYTDSVPGYIQRIFSNFEEKLAGAEGNSYRNQQLDKKELTSRIDSSDIPAILQSLDAGLGGSTRPVDLLLCTNMLSVGVDISRLGLMIINGQPKNHSEYIQASGRIGRSSPGIVISNYNYLKPRDLSHYENFSYYHSTLHKNVEPITVTPFASRARDRALFGVLVALVRLLEQRLARNDRADRFDTSVGYVSSVLDTVRNQIKHRVCGVDPQEQDETMKELEKMIVQWHEWAGGNGMPLVYKRNSYEKARSKENINYLLGAVTESSSEGLMMIPNSLREAEQPARLWYLPDMPSAEEDD